MQLRRNLLKQGIASLLIGTMALTNGCSILFDVNSPSKRISDSHTPPRLEYLQVGIIRNEKGETEYVPHDSLFDENQNKTIPEHLLGEDIYLGKVPLTGVRIFGWKERPMDLKYELLRHGFGEHEIYDIIKIHDAPQDVESLSDLKMGY